MASKYFCVFVTLLFAVASAGYPPKCRKDGERCIGAHGFPGVEWIPCCSGDCSTPDTSYGGYGKVCGPAKKYPHAPTCRKDGERCMGAHGFPAVEWISCCSGDCSVPDTSYGGYGKLCGSGHYHPPAPPAPKCRAEGERCAGAHGKPAVPWVDCCHGMSCDAPDTSYGGYGKVCSYGYVAPPPPAPKYVPPPPPKCLKFGSTCEPYGTKCCNYYACNKLYNSYGHVYYKCGHKPTAAPTTTKKYVPPPPKCLKKGSTCKPGYGPKCCASLVCNPLTTYYGQKSYQCDAAPTPEPPTTTTEAPVKPECTKNKDCKYGYKCCTMGYAKCSGKCILVKASCGSKKAC